MSVFNLMQTVAFYGFGAWVPTLLIAKGIHISTSLEYAFIIAIANPVGPLLGMLIADRMERKWQLVLAGVSIGAFIYLFANQSNPLLVILFGVMVTLSNNWMSVALHNYQGELFPTRIRGRAVGFVYAWSRATAAFAGLLIGLLLRQGGTPAVALFISAAMLIMVLTIGAFGPRAKGLALEDIAKESGFKLGAGGRKRLSGDGSGSRRASCAKLGEPGLKHHWEVRPEAILGKTIDQVRLLRLRGATVRNTPSCAGRNQPTCPADRPTRRWRRPGKPAHTPRSRCILLDRCRSSRVRRIWGHLFWGGCNRQGRRRCTPCLWCRCRVPQLRMPLESVLRLAIPI